MNALEVSLLVVVALLIALVVLIAVMFSKALANALVHAERVHERNTDTLSGVLDRFMAVDFAAYKAQAMAEGAESGEFVLPDEPEPYITQMSDEDLLASETTVAGRRLEDLVE